MNTFNNTKKTLAMFVPTYNRSLIINELFDENLFLYAKYDIDLYIYDSSEDDETDKIVKTFQNNFENLYYVRLPSDMHTNVKAYKIFQKYSWVRDYDYIWLCNDIKRFYPETISGLMDIISTSVYDIIILDQYRIASANNREYSDINQFFIENTWQLTNFGTSLLKTSTMLDGVNWGYLTEKYCVTDKVNFSHVCFYFEQILSLNSFKAIEYSTWWYGTRLKEHSGWYDSVFLVWLEYFPSAINALPNVYKNKKKAIKNHGKYSTVFSDRYLLGFKKDKILNIEIYKQYRKRWKMYSSKPMIKFFLYSILPTNILSSYIDYSEQLKEHKPIKRFFSLKRLKRFCKAYKNVYVYGAGKVADRYIEYLKKMKVDIQGIIVTEKDMKTKEILQGVPIIIFDMLQDWENAGLILGLNQYNAYEVKKVLLVKQFTGGIFDEYIRDKPRKDT